MDTKSTKDWGLIFGGIALAIVGCIVIWWPGLSVMEFAIIAGVFLLIAGVVDFINWFRFRKTMPKPGWAFLNALCNVILGVMFLLHPVMGAWVISWTAGGFIIAYGVFAIVAAIRLRTAGSGWGWMLLNGIISVICGLFFFFAPDFFGIFLGVFLLMRGVSMTVYGITGPANMLGM